LPNGAKYIRMHGMSTTTMRRWRPTTWEDAQQIIAYAYSSAAPGCCLRSLRVNEPYNRPEGQQIDLYIFSNMHFCVCFACEKSIGSDAPRGVGSIKRMHKVVYLQICCLLQFFTARRTRGSSCSMLTTTISTMRSVYRW
jgi:hypothetical protein